MLRQRIITAIVLLVPLIAAMIFLPVGGLAGLFLIVSGLAAWEWAGLAGFASVSKRALYVGVIMLISAIVAAGALNISLFPGVTQPSLAARLAAIFLRAALLCWLFSLWQIARYPQRAWTGALSCWLTLTLGAVLIPASVVGVIRVRESALGVPGLFTLFGLVWAADIAAYFAGRAFGRHKLAPRVSPGKTWEGFAGGLLGAIAVGIIAGYYLLPTPQRWAAWLLLCVGVAVISVIGDLTESLLKRTAGVKDSGRLLPGHGGVLDRIDSLLAAAPLMAIGLEALGLAR